ncbi:MAG TPA: division/cell wall cluster transcriptional repressor MraZ [Myxococcales bacterium]|nr:division/cell wall cluster transcriptional repressor MraZ [Myxococcales bacterium]
MDPRPIRRIDEEQSGVSFTGVFQHAIDAKGRTSLPSRFREVLAAQGAEKLFVTTDLFDSCLQAYAPSQWTAFTQRVAGLSQFDPAVRQLIRTFVAPAQECPVDKLGRILIPPTLRQHAGIDGEVTWAGSVDRIEVWAPARWAQSQEKARAPEVQAQLAQRLHQLL